MELENLRRQWSTPADTPRPLDQAALAQLLARGSRAPVARMRRNSWLEIGVVTGCLAGCLGAFAMSNDNYYLLAAWWLAGLGMLSGAYFYYKLRALYELGSTGHAAVREQVAQRLQSLRRLVRLYQRATQWAVPASLLVAMLFVGGRMVQQFSGDKLIWSLLLLAVAGGLAYFRLRGFTRQYAQNLYGQHLDRLEANLRELAEPGA